MKLRIVSLGIMAWLSAASVQAQVQGDPLVAGAVTAGDAVVSAELTASNKSQLVTMGTQATIVANLELIREYEDKMFKYLSTVNGVIQNAYDVTRCARLGESIIDNLGKCTKAAKKHPDGAIISALVSKRYVTILAESTALASYVGNLVKKGGKANLLNSAERNNILSNVTGRLSTINRQLVGLRYQIELLRWSDLARSKVPFIYSEAAKAEMVHDFTKRNIDQLIKRF